MARKSHICKGEHFMRIWIKNGVRMAILVTTLTGAGLACSSVSTDRYTLPTDPADRREDSFPASGTDATETPDTRPVSRTRIAGLLGLAVAVAGAGAAIRRRRRRAAGQEDAG